MYGPICNVMFFPYGDYGRAGTVTKNMDMSVGSEVAMRAQGDILKSCIGLEGVVP